MPFDARHKKERKLIHEYGEEKAEEIFYGMENLKKHHMKSKSGRQY